MSVGRPFQAAGPATQNVRVPSSRLVCGTTRSPWAAECTVTRIVTEYMGTHSSCKYDGADPFIALYILTGTA